MFQALADSLKGAKGSLTAIQCDVSKDDQILAMFGKIKKEFGGVDVCVNNAGLSHDAPLLTGSTEQWRHMLDVSLEIIAIYFISTQPFALKFIVKIFLDVPALATVEFRNLFASVTLIVFGTKCPTPYIRNLVGRSRYLLTCSL